MEKKFGRVGVAETGSRPSGQAPSGLDASRFDPARISDASFLSGVAHERERVIAWLEHHAKANQAASLRPSPAASPATTIDLRGRANSCSMHALWILLGHHHNRATAAKPESYSDAVTRLEAECERLRAALRDSGSHAEREDAARG